MKFINIRGCNGSGKTTLLRNLVRHFEQHGHKSVVVNYNVPDHKPIPVTVVAHVAIIGDYTEAAAGATTAGLDRIKTQAVAKAVIEAVAAGEEVQMVMFEGILVSTIFGPWLEWSQRNGGMVWAFLDTPLDVCLERIQQRNGGKPIKEDQVAGKHKTILRIEEKAKDAGEEVERLEWQGSLSCLRLVLRKNTHPGTIFYV